MKSPHPCKLWCSHIIGVVVTLLSMTRTPPMASGAELILQGPATITTTYKGLGEPLTFPISRWVALSNQARTGTLMQWTAGPFVNTREDRFVVDSRLQIAIANRRTSRTVAVIAARDETNTANGDQSATVAAVLLRPGLAGIELQVEFVPRNASTIAAGEYALRVVGTVTER